MADLDLDALEASVRQKEALFLTNVMVGRETVAALIAAARDRDRWHDAAFAGQAHEAQLTAERDAAQAALARVEALHTAVIEDGKPVGCLACDWDFDGSWPCATIRAVASEGQEAGA